MLKGSQVANDLWRRGVAVQFRIAIPLLCWGAQFAGAQIVITPGNIFFPLSPGTVTIADINDAHVKFKYAGVQFSANETNFIMVIPSSGTTPASVQIALNPNVAPQLRPSSTYGLVIQFTTVDQTPASSTSAVVTYRVPAEPPPAIQSVVNAASLHPVLSPGASVSIIGSHLTGPTLSTTFDDTASYPTSVASTSVTFNGIAAPLLYVSPSQINAIVPFSLAGQTSVQVAVQRFERVSASVTVPLQDTAPAIFTSTQNGTGQAAILQQRSDGSFTYNSSSNPAPAGAFVEMFATGEGVWTPPPQSDVFVYGEPFTTLPVSLTIGGQPAKLLYPGTIGMYANWSILQVNATVPSGLGSGPQPVVLTIGGNDNSRQAVVMWVQ